MRLTTTLRTAAISGTYRSPLTCDSGYVCSVIVGSAFVITWQAAITH